MDEALVGAGPESKLKALVSEAGLTPIAVVDVDCPWIYPNLDIALRAMFSAGPAERAIRNSGMDRARDAVANSIAPFLKPSGAEDIFAEELAGNEFGHSPLSGAQ